MKHFGEEILRNGAVVCLAWNRRSNFNNKTMEVLRFKMDSMGILYDIEAFEKYSRSVCLKLQDELCRNKKWTVGIELSGLAEDKHIGFLDYELIKQTGNNVRIVYFCHNYQSFLRISSRIENSGNIAVCLQNTHYDLIEAGVDVMLKVGGPGSTTRPDCVTVFLDHGVNDYKNLTLDRKYFDYLCVAGKKLKPFKENGVRIIKSGYLAFDCISREIESRINGGRKDAVFVAPYDNEEFDRFFPLIKSILNKYKVIMRHRGYAEPNWLNGSNQEKLEELVKIDHFILDDGAQIKIDTFLNAFVMLASKTTSKYSFALQTLSPSIVFSDSFESFDSQLGIVLGWESSLNDLFLVLDHIYKEQDFWKMKILDYRNRNIYNYGQASAYLAEYLISHFRGKDL